MNNVCVTFGIDVDLTMYNYSLEYVYNVPLHILNPVCSFGQMLNSDVRAWRSAADEGFGLARPGPPDFSPG